MVDEPRNIQREILPNGLTVLTETMEHIRSVSIGISLRTGSRDEDDAAIFTQNFWKDHPLGKPIAGTKDTVRLFDQELLLNYYARHIHPGNLIISAAGSLDHKKFVELVGERFQVLKPSSNGLHSGPPSIH